MKTRYSKIVIDINGNTQIYTRTNKRKAWRNPATLLYTSTVRAWECIKRMDNADRYKTRVTFVNTGYYTSLRYKHTYDTRDKILVADMA